MTILQQLDRRRATYRVALGRGARRRFETEVRALAKLPRTAGLLPVSGGGFDVDGHPFVERALDDLDDVNALDSLGHQVRREGRPLDIDTAVRAIMAVLDGVAALHHAGLVHGGIRPDVVLTSPTTGPVLADPVPPVVVAHIDPLDPAFAAPEVLQGQEPTAAADVYAVAATLVHLATGHGPWTGADADAEAVLLQIMDAAQPDIGVLAAHAGVAAAVVRALAGDPAARPDAAQLARALSGDPGPAADGPGPGSGTDRLDTVAPFLPAVPVASTTEDPTLPPMPRAARLGNGEGPVGTPAGTPLGSRYLLHEALGRGATGTVHRATCHDRTGAPAEVAVKVLREELTDEPTVVARFLAERTRLVDLDHPNLVRVRDLVAEGSTLAIVMDLVDGPDLRRWMRTAPPLPPAAACRLLAQLAGAVGAVHAAGVVHRDLKPENVLLERVGTAELKVRLTDFGVARSVRDAAARLTQHGQLVGTPAYLAPEVAAGAPAGPPADVYALGVLAYELLAGCRPFAGDQPLALAEAHATLAPGRPPGLDDRLWRVMTRCLAKDPAARPSADAVAGDLLDCATALGDDAPPLPQLDAPPPADPHDDLVTDPHDHLVTDVGTAPPPQRPPTGGPSDHGRRRRRLRIALAAGVALLVGAVAGALSLDREPDDPEPPPVPDLTRVLLDTRVERTDPQTVVLRFEPLPGADYRVIPDPDAAGGTSPVDVQVVEGPESAFVPFPDPADGTDHCYLVEAIVPRDPDAPSSTTSTSPARPAVVTKGCTQDQPSGSAPPS